MTPKELRTRRLEMGWTQKELADRCRIPVTRIRAFEEGEVVIDCAELLESTLRDGSESADE